jgi:hypothetical protein
MIALSCPFKVLFSHARFAEQREWMTEAVFLKPRCQIPPGTYFGMYFSRMVLTDLKHEEGRLEVKSPGLNTPEARTKFLDEFEAALGAAIGYTIDRPEQGTPFVQFDRYLMEIVEPHRRKNDHDPKRRSVQYSATHYHHFYLVSDKTGFTYNPLIQMYADGLRANAPKSKFFHWFVILEEFIEKNDRLNAGFSPLYDESERQKIRQLADGFSGPKKSRLIQQTSATREARNAKLAAMLAKLGAGELGWRDRQVIYTPEVCAKLIKQRNTLFHSSAYLDDDLLWNHLFPLVTALSRRSAELVD